MIVFFFSIILSDSTNRLYSVSGSFINRFIKFKPQFKRHIFFTNLKSIYPAIDNFATKMLNNAKKAYDAIIVGAGHNGLVTGNYLARAGKKVLILERRHLPGGAALTEQLIPGFRFSRCSYVLSLFRRNILEQLGLWQRGLKVHFRDINSITPTKNQGKYLLFHSRDEEFTKKQIAKFSPHDAQKWKNYNQFLNGICDFWDSQLNSIPINQIHSPSLRQKFDFVSNILKHRHMDPFAIFNFATSSVQTILNGWFQSDILKATLATDGIIGENLSIDDPSTAYVLLHHVMGELIKDRKGEWGYVEGGNGALSQLLARGFTEMGGEIMFNSPVSRILYESSPNPVGVRLQNGEVIEAKHIFSNCTHRVTFQQMVQFPEQVLSRQQLHKLRSIEYNGACTKLNIALKKLPKFKAFSNSSLNLSPEQLLQGTIHINCQSFQGLKQSFLQTKTNRISTNPFLDLTIPSIYDKTLCPQGFHIMNVLMQYTPYHPSNGQKDNSPIPHSLIKQMFLNTMNQYLQEPLDVHYMDILTPHDLEKMLGMTEGNIFHGAIGLDNIYVNRTSGRVGGIWVCGSAGHPGGGVMGAVGRSVALEALRQWQR